MFNCAVCTNETEGVKAPHTYGLVCDACYNLLRHAGNDASILRRLADYVDSAPTLGSMLHDCNEEVTAFTKSVSEHWGVKLPAAMAHSFIQFFKELTNGEQKE